MTQRLHAPGKVFLAGEYAVLDGHPALVAGIDRGLAASWEPADRLRLEHGAEVFEPGPAGGPPPAGLRFAARAAAFAGKLCDEDGLRPRGLRLVYEDGLTLGALKLGLGGSAAACVLAVRAVCAARGRALTGEETLALALAAHWTEQGGAGSGGDVAACALGGVLEVRARHSWRSPAEVLASSAQQLAQSAPLAFRRVRTPPSLRLLLAFSGASADTRALVRSVRAFAAASPAAWAARAAALALGSAQLVAALEGSEGSESQGAESRALDAVRAGALALAALGAAAGVALLTPALQEICTLAESAGAAAKPSGAGGGDCAIVLAFGDAALARAEAALAGFPTFRIAPA